MSYDVAFCTENDMRKNVLMSQYKEGTWQYNYAQKYGVFFDLSGWRWSNFIKVMRIDIGKPNPEDKDSFYIQVGDLRKMAKAIEAYRATEGAKRYEMYIDVCNVNGFHIYNPTLPFPTNEWDERTCWLSIDQVYEMKCAICSAGEFMEELWEIVMDEGEYFGDFAPIVNKIFADAPDDELVLVEESY